MPLGSSPKDEKRLAWVAAQGCMICGAAATVHHVRICGSARDDKRVLPLCPPHHLIQHGPRTSIEGLGKAKFEARYGVDIEAKVAEYAERYESEQRRNLHWAATREARCERL